MMIRKAAIQDMSWLLDVAIKDMVFNELKIPSYYNRKTIQKIVEKGIKEETFFIAEKDGIPVGAIGGVLTPHPYNEEVLVLSEQFWYVLPEYRNSSAGARLLAAFQEKGKDADEVIMSLLIDSPISFESLEKRGFGMVELSFRKGSKW